MLVPVDKPTYIRAWMRLIPRPANTATITLINSWIVGDADRTSCEHGVSKWDDSQMVDDAVIITIAPIAGPPDSFSVDDAEKALEVAMSAMSEHSVGCQACTTAVQAQDLCSDGLQKLTAVFKLKGILEASAAQRQAGSSQAAQGQAGSSQAAQGQAGSSQAAQGQAGSSEAAQGQAGSSQAAQGQAGSSQAAQGQAGSSQAAQGQAGSLEAAQGQAGSLEAAQGQAGSSSEAAR